MMSDLRGHYKDHATDLRGHYKDHGPLECKVYVGDVGPTAARRDLEDAFGYYGPLKNIWVARKPPGFAFVEFVHPYDAEDAVSGMDGKNICGRRIRVEMSTGGKRPRSKRSKALGRVEKCHECGKEGHYAKECITYPKYQTRNRSRSKSPRSFSPVRYRGGSCSSRSRSPHTRNTRYDNWR